MSKRKTCEHCAHFLSNDGKDGMSGGICRRFPPVAMLMQQPNTILGAGAVGMAGVSPPVDDHYTCGEFQVATELAIVSTDPKAG